MMTLIYTSWHKHPQPQKLNPQIALNLGEQALKTSAEKTVSFYIITVKNRLLSLIISLYELSLTVMFS